MPTMDRYPPRHVDAEDNDLDEEMDFEEDVDEPIHLTVNPELPRLAEDKERQLWESLDLEQRFKSVMDTLKDNHRRWDDSTGDPGIPVLEEYKRTALTKRHPFDKTLPTALHILAKHHKRDYQGVPWDIQKAVVHYLLRSRVQGTDDITHSRSAQDQPVLTLAKQFDNDAFIDCVLECCPDEFPRLLDIQDSEGKNFLHHVFALPPISYTFTNIELNKAKRKAMARAEKFVPHAKPQTLAAKDVNGNTPLHYAADYRQCFGRKTSYIDMLCNMLLKSDELMGFQGAFNNNGESPILYCQRTQAEYKQWQQETSDRKSAKVQPTPAAPDKHNKMKEQGTMKALMGKTSQFSFRFQSDMMQEPGALSGTSSKEIFMPDRDSGDMRSSGPTKSRKKDTAQAWTSERGGDSGARKAFANSRPSSPSPAMTHPSALATEQRTMAQLPQGQIRRNDVGERPVNIIIQFFKRHYIRTRKDLDARDLIEGKDQSDKNLYFDASGHKEVDKIIRLISRMSAGGFFDTLSYVYLPLILLESQDSTTDTEGNMDAPVKSYPIMNQGKSRRKASAENPNLGRNSLVDVFSRLYEVGVRAVLRLEVDDWEPPSHTDSAIEQALQGVDSLLSSVGTRPIHVETWDWRKPDLSLDVVAFAAPAVEHLHLYWSGNQAVLKGWSCPTGIAQLHSSTKRKLKTVTVHASPGIENNKRMEKMLKEFKNEVTAQLENQVEIKIHHPVAGLFPSYKAAKGAGAAGSGSGNDEAERQHAWVRRMEDFRRAMISLHTVLQSMNLGTPERVKVALIDDGVDLSSLDSYNDIVQATGLSYYPPDGNFEMPWHRSSTGHGTIMANMIVRINPWVTLYVMKIQDGPSSDNIGRTIFADSTAKAIRGAISRKVDVISMSWTVKKKTALVTGGAGGSHIQATSVEGDAIRELEDALQAAIDAKILLFCSASDDIQAKGTDYLPYSKDPHYIFRIGAALSLGQRDPHAEDKENINYFFPGNQVADALNPRSTAQVRYHDGSSVGTALAAGLASMVIYCAVIMQTWYKARLASSAATGTPANTSLKTYYKKFEGIAAEVRRRDRMERAFDRVVRWNPKSIEDKKYLPVWESFGVAADSIHEAVGERKLEILEEFVMKLCS